MTSLASFEGAISWSKDDYSMKDVVEGCEHFFPLLCRTTVGYSGCDEDILQIGSGEIYWVFDVLRQQRLVVQDERANYFLSIPVEYPIKVQIVQERTGKVGPPVPMGEVLKEMQKRSNTVKMIFENNCPVSFHVGPEFLSSAIFGLVTTRQTYYEKYLLAYTVGNKRLFTRAHAIPVYLPITFALAEGLIHGDADAWSDWKMEVISLTKTLKNTPIRTNQEIILFNERPSNGEYDYIQLSDFSHFKEKDKIYSAMIVRRGEKCNDYQQHLPSHKINQNISISSISANSNRNHSVPLPRFPHPAPLALTGASSGRSNPSFSSSEKFRFSNRTSETCEQPPIQKGLNPRSSGTASHTPMSGGIGIETPLPHPATLERSGIQDKPMKTKEGPYEGPNSTPERTQFHRYASLSDVPVDLDFSTLSVEEVVDCLKLLKLDRHCEQFRSRQIDGRMLMCLNEKMLIEDFTFRNFDATQFVSFVKTKWRPKRAQ